MSEHTENHIGYLINLNHEGIAGEHDHAADEARRDLESLIREDPAAAMDALMAAHAVLELPETTDRTLRRPAAENGLSDYHTRVVTAIAGLLHHTDHGRYIEFDDRTYDAFLSDEHNRKLIQDVQNKNNDRRIVPEIARRRVALGSIATRIQVWHADQLGSKPDSGSAA